MTVRLSVYLPMWASELTLRRLGGGLAPGTGEPVVLLTRVDHQREVVAACCAAAQRAGVSVGMTVAHARALIGGEGAIVCEPLDERGAVRALERLARWAVRFVPVVAVDPPDGLWMDATGCGRLYASPRALGERIIAAMERLGFHASIGIAPTWGAAWALARFGGTGRGRINTASPGGLVRALDRMPVCALRIEPAVVDALGVIGIERIGELRALPRKAVADRYGGLTLLRLDQALGQAVEMIEPVRLAQPVVASRLLDGPTDRLEVVELVVQGLVEQAASLLHARESGCRRLVVTLLRSDMPPLELVITTAHPTRDVRHLWTLLRPKVESAHLGFGVEGAWVKAMEIAPLPHEQRRAWQGEGEHAAGCDAVGRLVDTLAARLGRERITRLRVVESHLPERVARYEPVERLEGGDSTGAALVEADRPSLLYERPIPVEPMLLLPDGPIARLHTSGGEQHLIVVCIGPERIEEEWWRGVDSTPGSAARDYFKVQADSGRWLWVFREPRRGGWFIHGEWA